MITTASDAIQPYTQLPAAFAAQAGARVAVESTVESTAQSSIRSQSLQSDSIKPVFDPSAISSTRSITPADSAQKSAFDPANPATISEPQSNQNPEQAATQSQEDSSAAELQQVEQVVAQLKARDTEVRAHEMAHVAAGGQYVTSGPSYSYQTGPDGKAYAIGGEVGIDMTPIANDPEGTIAKMQQVQAAALAPAEPSSQDYKVAAQARQNLAQAQAEVAQQTTEAASGEEEGADKADNAEPSKAPQGIQPNSQAADQLNNPLTGARESEDSQGAIRLNASQTKASESEAFNGLLGARQAFDLRQLSQGW